MNDRAFELRKQGQLGGAGFRSKMGGDERDSRGAGRMSLPVVSLIRNLGLDEFR
jgi:hypothetical protein